MTKTSIEVYMLTYVIQTSKLVTFMENHDQNNITIMLETYILLKKS
jgi:hypothetical protein